MKKLIITTLLFLSFNNAQAGFLCDMLIMDVFSTQEYEQALQGLRAIQDTKNEIEQIRKSIVEGKGIDKTHPGLGEMHSLVKEALVEEEKAQGRNATITIAVDAGALTFAYLLWKNYRSHPQAMTSVIKDAFEKKYNRKVWLLPGLVVTTLIGAGYMRHLLSEKKMRINSLREQLQTLAKAQVKQEYLSYLEDIIDDNQSTLAFQKAKYIKNGCLKDFEYEDGQSYCVDNEEIDSDEKFIAQCL